MSMAKIKFIHFTHNLFIPQMTVPQTPETYPRVQQSSLMFSLLRTFPLSPIFSNIRTEAKEL